LEHLQRRAFIRTKKQIADIEVLEFDEQIMV